MTVGEMLGLISPYQKVSIFASGNSGKVLLSGITQKIWSRTDTVANEAKGHDVDFAYARQNELIIVVK